VSSTPPEPNYSWQPQPGNFKSAPPYGQPPRKSRAGLIIGLIVLLIFVAVGAIGVLAYRLVANHAVRFGLTFVELPFKRQPDPIVAITPRAAMSDKGIAFVINVLAACTARERP